MAKTKKLPKKLSEDKEISNTKELKISKDKLEHYIKSSLDNMKQKQEVMLKTYNFGRKNNQFIFFPNHKKFYLFDKVKGEAFFEAQFQIIGTFASKSSTWRFAWANRYVPNELKRTSLRLKEFGESNNLDIFSQPKVQDSELGVLFTAIGMKLSNAKGYYIVPEDGKFPEVHLIFTKIKKIKRSIKKIQKDFQKGNETKKLRYKKMINHA
jgi:hypothetical protein